MSHFLFLYNKMFTKASTKIEKCNSCIHQGLLIIDLNIVYLGILLYAYNIKNRNIYNKSIFI